LITEACNSSSDLVDRGDEEPGGCALDSSFEVFGEAVVAVQPGDGALDHPAAQQQFEAFCGVGPFDDFQRSIADVSERIAQFFASLAAIGEYVSQPREVVTNAGEHIRGAVAVGTVRIFVCEDLL